MNLNSKAPNKRKQSDLGELSPFLQEAAKIPPSHPTRCFGRYVPVLLGDNEYCFRVNRYICSTFF
jgi:hypothetical protein